jgi:hypothetical protein
MISVVEWWTILKTTGSLTSKEVNQEHVIGCFMRKNAQSSPRVRAELPDSCKKMATQPKFTGTSGEDGLPFRKAETFD